MISAVAMLTADQAIRISADYYQGDGYQRTGITTEGMTGRPCNTCPNKIGCQSECQDFMDYADPDAKRKRK